MAVIINGRKFQKPEPVVGPVEKQFRESVEKAREAAFREKLPTYRELVTKAASGAALSVTDLTLLDEITKAMGLSRKEVDDDVATLVELAGLEAACQNIDERIRAEHATMVRETGIIQDLPTKIYEARQRHAAAEGKFMHLTRQRRRRDVLLNGTPRMFDRPTAEVEPAKPTRRRKVG